MKYKIIVCGGTFDHFHEGHKKFLEHGLSISKMFIIGITSDRYIKKFKDRNIETYKIRKKTVLDFLIKNKISNNFKIVKIDSNKIPKNVEELGVDALIVSQETKKGALEINRLRICSNNEPYEIIIHPLTYAEDGSVLSSSRIRSGEVNRLGKAYLKPEWLKISLFLPQKLRPVIAKPFGPILTNLQVIEKEPVMLVTVGDVVTKHFHDLGVRPDIAVVDLRVERKEIFKSLEESNYVKGEKIFYANNPAGRITPELFKTICKIIISFKKEKEEKFLLMVTGEEDLSVLPLVVVLPLNSQLYYGQPGSGMVKLIIDEGIKERAHKYLSSFNSNL